MDKDKASEKLMKRVVKSANGCWEWQGGKSGGYGHIVFKGRETWLCHRLAWFLANGDIPKGKFVCHRCDNPSCCNPEHLFLGSSVENTTDRHDKRRDATGEQNGSSKLSDSQVDEIRKRYDGQYGRLKQLAQEYNVSSDQIRNIIRGRQRMSKVSEVNWTTCRLRRSGTSPTEHLGGKKSKTT